MARGPPIYTKHITFRVRPETKEKFDELSKEERNTITSYLRSFTEKLLQQRF